MGQRAGVVLNSADGDFDLAPPHASSLAESLRAFGYELPTAIADLVDNSIFAGAANVWIQFHWDGKNSAITVTDDGSGMDEATLRDAMRPGSRNPRDTRDPRDLGRFGLGLKTASFSQARCVTVRTKQQRSKVVSRCWDLDHIARVNDWQLLRSHSYLAAQLSARLDELPSGTSVVWERLDRLTAGDETDDIHAEDRFLARADAVRDHLACVFHRFLEGPRALRLHLGKLLVEPWDPFLADGKYATIRKPVERLKFRDSAVEVEPFVLPHLSKVDAATHKRAAGPRGWNLHQGFYVYRNRRLLVAGDWLGIKGWKPEEHYKLARIRVDLPNTLDLAWEIDVTKSKASPPAALRVELERIGSRARALAKRIYSHRGARLTTTDESRHVFLWQQKARHNQVFYRINRDHPLVKASLATSTDKAKIHALLKLVEQTIPVPLITITDREQPDQTLGPFEGVQTSEILGVMEQIFLALTTTGYTPREAFERLSATEPFQRFPAELETFAETNRIQP
jgi:hypothetical protein